MIEQGSAEWHKQRCGKITASRFCDALALLKSGKPSEARQKYMRELVFEVLSGVPKHSAKGLSLEWGKELEEFAREAYEIQTGNIVTLSGFITHPNFPFIGSSPDGLVDDDGGIEIKCPHDESVHIKTLLEGMDSDHIGQVQGNMFVTGRKWWDFISYDPRQKSDFQIYIQRIERDESYIETLEEKLCGFWDEVNSLVEKLKNKKVAA